MSEDARPQSLNPVVLTRHLIKLQAQVEALRRVAGVLAAQIGIDPADFMEMLTAEEEAVHHEILIAAEESNPAFAAGLDDRPVPGLDDPTADPTPPPDAPPEGR